MLDDGHIRAIIRPNVGDQAFARRRERLEGVHVPGRADVCSQRQSRVANARAHIANDIAGLREASQRAPHPRIEIAEPIETLDDVIAARRIGGIAHTAARRERPACRHIRQTAEQARPRRLERVLPDQRS